jgi:DNA (cytosine-5)-methyltransferase 1
VLDLFSGIGGISLGLESTGGFETAAFCEVDPFCREVLAHHWPGVPIHDDVRRLTALTLGGLQPDAIVGGAPCQPFSVAGKQQGQADERHLWPHFARLVRELRPRWVIAENVPGIRGLAADEVLADLEAAGYSCWPLVVGADDVGAPHRRKRVWFVAHFAGEGRGRGEEALAHGDEAGRVAVRGCGLQHGVGAAQRDDVDGRGAGPVGEPTGSGSDRHASRTEAQYPVLGIASTVMGDSERCGLRAGRERQAPDADASGPRWPARPGEPQHEWEEPRLSRMGHADQPRADAQPAASGSRDAASESGARSPEFPLGSAVDGLPERLVRRANRESLKALGNSVVPQVVAMIGRAILSVEAQP